ncbi:MAG: hypothetical protein A3C58_00750 [Candidatus Staskawiczbacteria bacterium RIFCSPHIGHO2_02_FULL_34_10]|uniref:Response regulatory domain-containing protein n=1 Tax=Candidatus Staskawiczbacteria bacterium RIFCSPHIGHO2_02_FULL_34_10 TaxID=1802205 RepID=A0A1G2HX37_9BACT|nr:MAG: hypothetical protein A3C58_00750 [Candidatus Staskawiczbacteria bacterium RIFCSPHIGHO2_02_FULL_34_10]
MSKNKQSILIIEDDGSYRSILVKKLTEEGFLAIEAKDGEEGLNISLEKHPDLILLDLIMPRMDGITMLKELREDEWGKNAKIIILTAIMDSQKIAQAIENSAFEYIIKTDTTLDDVVERIKKRLK